MRISNQPAFVLHRRQYSETSLLLETFTRDHGRIGLIARGARGSKSALPALLQPFQELHVDFMGAGELQRLVRAEAPSAALALRSERSLAGLYCNELIVRLLPRGDAFASLYQRYCLVLQALVDTPSMAWVLRCFERDLLAELGYATDFSADAEGMPIEVDLRYRFEPESGFVAVVDNRGYSGKALLAMSSGIEPGPALMRELRLLLRDLVSLQLRGEPLRSWGLLAGLARPGPSDAGP